MTKVFGFLIAALLLGSTAAAEFPNEGEVLLVAEGSVVGVGEFDDGDLELRLLAGFSGFAEITVVDESGNEYSTEVMVGSDSSVTLSDSLEDLESVLAEAGAEVTVTVHDSLEAGGNMAFGAGVPEHVELPQVALDGMAGAEANHQAAQERAEEARAKAGAAAGGEVEVGDDGEVAAGAGASVGLGLGLGSEK